MASSDSTLTADSGDTPSHAAFPPYGHDVVCANPRFVSQQRLLSSTTPSIEIEACFRLRHAYFVQERGWVKEDAISPGLESDRYDPDALHLSVWEGDEVAAYLRVLPFDPDVGFMLDHELSAILSPQEREALPRESAVELSRLVCRSSRCLRSDQGMAHPMELLIGQLHHLSQERGFRRFYIVVEADWLRPFARRFGLPFQVIGRPHVFPDGTKTVAATATTEELEAGLRRRGDAGGIWHR